MKSFSLIAITILLLIVPENCYAFGPYAHIYFGNYFITNLLSSINPFLFALINRYPIQYYYGNIAADIVIGKNISSYLFHCHNWRQIYKLLEQAVDEDDQVFLLGYLTHILADIVAHNYFVPLKYIDSYPYTFRGHIYWEVKFDKKFKKDAKIREIVKKIQKCTKLKKQNELLKRFITGTVIKNFEINLRLFKGWINIENFGKPHIKNSLFKEKPNSKIQISEQEYSTIQELVILHFQRFFIDHEVGNILEIDPRGIAGISMAKMIRKELRKLYKIKMLEKNQTQDVRNVFTPFFKQITLGERVRLPNLGDLREYLIQHESKEKSSNGFSAIIKFIKSLKKRKS